MKISSRQLSSLLVLLNVPEEYRDKIIEYPKFPTSNKPLSSSHVEEIEKLSNVNKMERKSELYSLIMERTRKARADGIKIYSHRDIRSIVTMSNAQPERSIQEIAAEIKKGHSSTNNNGTTKIICPMCKGRGYLYEGPSISKEIGE